MKLVANWRTVLKNSWAIRFALLGATLTAIEVWMPQLSAFTDPRTFLVVSFIINVGASAARVVSQAALKQQDCGEKPDA